MGTETHKVKNVLILTADAGFGHRSAAIAVEVALNAAYGEQLSITLINPLDHKLTPAALRRTQQDYDRVVKDSPQLYKLGYEASSSAIPGAIMESTMTVALFDTMRRVIHDNSPDLIITTYPLYLAPLDAVFTLNQRYVPVFTIITDMVSVHRLWFNGVSAMTYVATDAVKNMGVNFGIREEQISITGIPVHPGVSAESRDKTAIRKELGWDPTLKTILAVASRRVGHMWETLRLINHSNLSIQLVITAGGDLELYNEALYTDWHQPTHLYNFVDQMPTFMHAADAIICKAGGLITTEALACGLPILLVDVLPGQEEGNAQIVVDGGAGDWPESPIDALETVYHWLMNDGALLKERAGNAAKLGRPQSAVQIAREVWEALESENCTRKDYRILDIPTFSDLLDRFDIPWREALSGNLFRSSD